MSHKVYLLLQWSGSVAVKGVSLLCGLVVHWYSELPSIHPSSWLACRSLTRQDALAYSPTILYPVCGSAPPAWGHLGRVRYVIDRSKISGKIYRERRRGDDDYERRTLWVH